MEDDAVGYHTDFEGRFSLDKPLTKEHQAILSDIASQEHYPGAEGMPTDLGSYHCQWVPTPDGTGIVWDGQEKFYCYVEWLQYLIDRFLTPWGYWLNGTVRWQGEGFEDELLGVVMDDEGTIYVRDSVIEAVSDGAPA